MEAKTTDPQDRPRLILPPGVTYPDPKPNSETTPELQPDDTGGMSTLAGKLHETEQQLTEARAKIADLEAEKLRLYADFENSRKRLQRTADERLRYAVQPFATDLLNVVDNLDRALNSTGSDSTTLRHGVELVRQQLFNVFNQHGLQEVPAMGIPFDPTLHEIIEVRDQPDVPPQTVVHVLARGFKLHDRVVRAAKVAVAQSPAPTSEPQPEPKTDSPHSNS